MSDVICLEYLGILLISALVFITTLLICAELIDTFTETSCPSIPCRQRAQNLHRLLRWLRIFPDSNPGIGQRALRFITDAALPQGVALLAFVAWGIHLALNHQVPSLLFCYLVDILAACLVLQWALLVVDRRARARRERAVAAANGGRVESVNEMVADEKSRAREERARARKDRAASAGTVGYYPIGMMGCSGTARAI